MRLPVKVKRPRMEFPFAAPTVPLGVDPPPARKRTGIDYDTDWARRFPARWTRTVILEAVLAPLTAGLARPERRGADRLADLAEVPDGEQAQPVIFVANHHSHIDSLLLLTSLPEPWRYKVFVGAAADYFFANPVSSAASALALNAIPIERVGVTRRSIDQAQSLIADGWSLVIFPEGGRSPDGWGQAHKPGAAWLAQRAGVPVVPVHLAGTGRILAKGKNRPTPGRTIVTFGSPMWADEGEEPRDFARRIEVAVAALADEATGDWYAARRRAHAGETPGLSGPDLASWRRAWALGARTGRARPKRRWPDLG